MKGRRIASLSLAVASASFASGCIPAYEFGNESSEAGVSDASEDTTLGGPDSSNDATVDGEGALDAPPDTRIDAPTFFAPTPVAILGSNGIATQSGNAQQQHLVFVTNSQRWWLFYLDAEPSLLKTKWSVDFTTWTDGAALTLPMGHGGEGRNFSVAYKDFGGRDVIHAATSLHDDPKRIVWDTRATIAGDTITWETPSLVHDLDVVDNIPDGGATDAGSQGGDSCDPDGVGVAIGAGGRVHIATSWVSVPGCCYCDSNFGTSLTVDDGTSWDAGFQAPLFHITVPGTTSARQILALSSGNMLAGWETADNVPPSDVTWGSFSLGAWNPESSDDSNFWVFPQTVTQSQEKNDWSFCRIDDNDIHAVHRKYAVLSDGGFSSESRVFEHYRFDGASWTFQSALADDVGVPGSGVTLVTNGTSLLAATIAADGSDSIRYATWSAGAWSAWRSLVGPDGGAETRAFVSGTGCADPAHPAILWTQGASAPYQLYAVPVAGLMP